MPGVLRTTVGYCGGEQADPTYRQMADHTESIQIEYDPAIVSYEQLLERFWADHDPTAQPLSRQYASILFYHDTAQREAAAASAQRLAAKLGRTIRTELRAAGTFYPAEDYHQKYLLRQRPALVKALDGCGGLDSTAAARLNGLLGGHIERGRLPAELEAIGLAPADRQRILDALGK